MIIERPTIPNVQTRDGQTIVPFGDSIVLTRANHKVRVNKGIFIKMLYDYVEEIRNSPNVAMDNQPEKRFVFSSGETWAFVLHEGEYSLQFSTPTQTNQIFFEYRFPRRNLEGFLKRLLETEGEKWIR